MKGILIIGKQQSGKTYSARKLSSLLSKNVAFVNAEHFIQGGRFVFSECNKHTDTIVIDELPSSYDLEKLVSLVTCEFFIVEKRGQRPFQIQPKYLIVTIQQSDNVFIPFNKYIENRFMFIHLPPRR